MYVVKTSNNVLLNFEKRQKHKKKISAKLLLSFLAWFEIFEALPQEDVVLLLRVVELVAHGPVVRHGVGEDLAIGVEGARSDGHLHGLGGFQLRSGILQCIVQTFYNVQGCQIFLGALYQNKKKYTKRPKKYQMDIHTKHIPNSSKIYTE
jgi:hypothetical protein